MIRVRKSRLLFALIGLAGALLLAGAGRFMYRGQKTLASLTHPEGFRTLDIYSRWLNLDPSRPVTRSQILAWLAAVSYVSTPDTPERPGCYQDAGDLTILARPFQYPDQAFPLQQIRLKFRGDRLQAIEGSNGQALAQWRLEPKVLAQWAAEPRTAQPRVRLEELPPHVPQAILAVEDKRFYQHGAFDMRSLARALWVDLRHAQLRQGASTISQQLARSIFLDVSRTLRRKMMEAILALYLSARYSKPQLLEMYLNQVYWGQDGLETMLGIESASRSYFSKPARQLTVAQSALLAGLLQSPNRLSPRAAPEPALARRDHVLRLMRDQGLIPSDAYARAVAEPLSLAPARRTANDAAYFLALLRDQLADRYSLPLLMGQGWKVFSTLDPTLQPWAAQAVRALRPSTRRASQKSPEHPEGALVALAPQTGAVLAWMGGTDFATRPYDRAVLARRQPGSALKPFVMLAALESRQATTATFLEDKPLTVKNQQGTWAPQNYDRQFRGRVSVWAALVHSLNIPTVRLAMQVGLPLVVDTAHRAGIQSPLKPVPSLALGTSEVSVLELTRAYSTLANEGIHAAPYMIETIMDGQGKVVETHQPEITSAFASGPVYLVTRMLQAVLREGTARQAGVMGFHWEVAGKTGTSENYQDAWFLGYSPDLACGVWVGYDRPRTLGRAAASIALPVWTRFMDKALAIEGVREFAIPKDLVWKTIDTDSGLLVRVGCIHRRKTAFLPGTEPARPCDLHRGGLLGLFKRLTGPQ